MRGDNVMGGRVGGGGQSDRGKASEHRAYRGTSQGTSCRSLVRVGVCSGPQPADAQNRALVFFSPPFAVRGKPQTSQRKLHSQTEHRERQRELSSDEPRRIFEKAALLFEGFMAMEYGLPFQEGTTGELAAGRFDGLNFLSLLIYIPLLRNRLSVFSGFNHPPPPPPSSHALTSLPLSFQAVLSDA